MNLHFEIFSKAMYSTWTYHKDSATLFDVGEGCANYFENRVFAINNILLTHHHGDHLLGFMPFLLTRCSAMGDQDKKINVFYPANNIRIQQFFSFIKNYYSKESQILNLIEIKENQNILDLTENHYIRTFKTNHTEDSLGYVLVEKRRRLKKEFFGQNIRELSKDKSIILNETYEKRLFSYAVDVARVDPKDIEDSKLLFVDSTFLNIEDRSLSV